MRHGQHLRPDLFGGKREECHLIGDVVSDDGISVFTAFSAAKYSTCILPQCRMAVSGGQREAFVWPKRFEQHSQAKLRFVALNFSDMFG